MESLVMLPWVRSSCIWLAVTLWILFSVRNRMTSCEWRRVEAMITSSICGLNRFSSIWFPFLAARCVVGDHEVFWRRSAAIEITPSWRMWLGYVTFSKWVMSGAWLVVRSMTWGALPCVTPPPIWGYFMWFCSFDGEVEMIVSCSGLCRGGSGWWMAYWFLWVLYFLIFMIDVFVRLMIK